MIRTFPYVLNVLFVPTPFYCCIIFIRQFYNFGGHFWFFDGVKLLKLLLNAKITKKRVMF